VLRKLACPARALEWEQIMDTNRAYIGAAILIGIVIFSNLILYGMARSISRNMKNVNYMKTMQNLMRNPLKKQDAPLEELRKKWKNWNQKRKKTNTKTFYIKC
jgi:hypothetical protein